MEYSALQRKFKAQIEDRARSEEFWNHSEQLFGPMVSELYKLKDALPDFSGLSAEEINYYVGLLHDERPYVKYPGM